MVFLHGWGCDHRSLAAQEASFAGFGRTLTVDLRGHGASGAVARDHSIGAMADDVAWLCGERGFRHAILVGHSMGGQIALRCAARNANLAAAVVMIDSAILLSEAVLARTRLVLDALGNSDYRAMLPGLTEAFFLTHEDPAAKAYFLATLSSTPQHVLAAALASHTVAYDALEALTNCRVPIAFIASEAPLADVERLRRTFPAIRIAQTLGAGHFSPMTAPDQINAMLQTFAHTLA